MHHVEAGPADGEVVLCLHGEPSWSYLYRKMLPPFAAAGYRAVAPDLVGFGRSDKPAARSDYTYARHLDWLRAWIDAAGLTGINLVCEDWGGLLGLRLAAEEPERFHRIAAANTFLPTGDQPASEAFLAWKKFSQESPKFWMGLVPPTSATHLGHPDDRPAGNRKRWIIPGASPLDSALSPPSRFGAPLRRRLRSLQLGIISSS